MIALTCCISGLQPGLKEILQKFWFRKQVSGTSLIDKENGNIISLKCKVEGFLLYETIQLIKLRNTGNLSLKKYTNTPLQLTIFDSLQGNGLPSGLAIVTQTQQSP